GPMITSSSSSSSSLRRNEALTFLYTYAKDEPPPPSSSPSPPPPPSGVTSKQMATLVETFNRHHLIAVRYCGLATLGILIQLPGLLLSFLLNIGPHNLGLEVAAYLFFAIQNNIQGIFIIFFVVNFTNQGFLVRRLFRF